ncbi:TrmH family RNA methyltransferase [Aestuariivirga sp.]|jgi:TrmH family RNA methyltransferase|uniref:TrmH family RNA methyltransferase n=1 Tax=Aestuariivirga sp. TaxID=2650926 RepID=UPI003784058C
MLTITSSQNPTIKLIRSLTDKKRRLETGLFVAEGPKVLARAREQGWEPRYLLSTTQPEPWGNAVLMRVEEKLMASLSAQTNPPSLLGVFDQKLALDVEPRGVWLALEDLRDPGNLGTIIRTADAFGATGIILVGSACDPFSPDCVRATMGSIFAIPIVKHSREAFLDLLRSWPGESVGTSLTATSSFRQSYKGPLLVVMGSEGSGLSQDTAGSCAKLVHIPMRGGAQSLNVAVAAGLMLFEIQKP